MFLQLQLQTEEVPKVQLCSLEGQGISSWGRNALLPALLVVLTGPQGFVSPAEPASATVNLLLHGKGNMKPSKQVILFKKEK